MMAQVRKKIILIDHRDSAIAVTPQADGEQAGHTHAEHGGVVTACLLRDGFRRSAQIPIRL